MRITKVEIDRFGVWRQLALPVSGRGLTLFYGPNEAGKTTLWRFIRSMLYGFEPFEIALENGAPQPVRWEGSLHVEAGTMPFSIHRISDRGTRGLVSVVGTDRQEPAESLLAELLFRTNESLFDNVFAVGLNELQQLATLEDCSTRPAPLRISGERRSIAQRAPADWSMPSSAINRFARNWTRIEACARSTPTRVLGERASKPRSRH
jgi:uncharacterized protein YhaN